MSNPLEKFILENREKFDADTPNPQVWEKINKKMDPESKKVVPLGSRPFKSWLAAAAAVVMIAFSGMLYNSFHNDKHATGISKTKTVEKTTEILNPPRPDSHPLDSTALVTKTEEKKENAEVLQTDRENELNEGNEYGENKEMYYYAKLIDIKHEELKTLEKDEPLLYRQFASDVQKLDSVYHNLKTQLPNNSNREQVIEAMISNLQLQIGLLNKQLKIIKQIKHSKKSAYEKAYKSV